MFFKLTCSINSALFIHCFILGTLITVTQRLIRIIFIKKFFLIENAILCNHLIIHLFCQYIIKSGGTFNTIESSTNVHINLVSCIVSMVC